MSLPDSTASEHHVNARDSNPSTRRGALRRRFSRRFLAVGLSAAIAIVLTPAAVMAAVGDWTQFRESQAHQAHNTAETLISDVNVHALGLAWTGATGSAVNSSPAVANGVVYVG